MAKKVTTKLFKIVLLRKELGAAGYNVKRKLVNW